MKDVVSSEKVCIEEELKESEKTQDEQINKPLRDLMEIIHFTENVSVKIHGVLDEAEVYRTVKEEFAKSKRYNVSIFLLTDDGTKLMLIEASLSPKKIKVGEKVLEIRSYKGYKFDLNKSNFFSRVVKEGKTIEANFIDVVSEFFPRPLAHLITKTIGYEKRSGILTLLKQYGKVIGVLVVDSVLLAEHFVLSVKNLAQHVSTALELAKEYAERKKAQEALRGSEERYKELTESISDTFFAMDKNLRYAYWNKASEKLTGISAKDAIGKSLTEVFPDVKGTKIEQVYLETLRTRQPQSYVNKYQLRGKDYVFEINAYPTKAGLSVFVKDITERKKNEVALRQSEERFRQLFSSMPSGVAVYEAVENGEDFVFRDFNAGAEKIEKISKDKVVGKRVTQVFLGVKSFGVFEVFQRVWRTGQPEYFPAAMYKDDRDLGTWRESWVYKLPNGNIVAIYNDITDRKKAEEKLRETKNYLDNLLNYANAPIIVWDNKNKISLFNNAFEALTGYKKESVLGRNIDVLFPPLQKEEILQTIEKATKGEKWQSVEVPILCKGKETRIALWNSANITDKDGNIVATIAQGQDITERKKTASVLKESEERYRDLVEREKDIIYSLDDKGKITFANPAVETILGYRPEEMIDKNFMASISKELQEKTAADFNNLLKTGEITTETVLLDKKGHPHSVEYSSTVIKDGNKVVGTRGIVRDVTERKRMEEKLRQYSEHLEELVQKRTEELLESEKRYSVLVEEASDGVVIFQDEKIAFTNKKGAELIGYSKDELLGVPFEKLVSEKHRLIVRKRYEERLRGEKLSETFEIELIAKTGEYIQIELTDALVHYQGRPADLIIIRDIRERKQMEEERLKLEKLATIGELATMVAHDLRNPLTSIRNASYYIKNTCPHHAKPECKAALEMFDIIEQGTLFANNIINDLLDFAAKRPLQKEKQDINKIVDSSITISNIPENIKIERKFAKKAIVTVDEKQLQRVFLNLTRNAVQAMPNGGKLTIKTSETKDHAEIEFRDTGIGIADENMTKLFTPFFTTKAKGIGMGLAICKKIVEQHNGTIEVKNKLSQGTTFTIKLPKKEEANNQ